MASGSTSLDCQTVIATKKSVAPLGMRQFALVNGREFEVAQRIQRSATGCAKIVLGEERNTGNYYQSTWPIACSPASDTK